MTAERPPTSDRLRHDIDRGRGGSKVDASDPAAAPLGTDDEAAGTPPSASELRMAHETEINSSPSERSGDDWAVPLYATAIIAIGVTIVAGALFFR